MKNATQFQKLREIRRTGRLHRQEKMRLRDCAGTQQGAPLP